MKKQDTTGRMRNDLERADEHLRWPGEHGRSAVGAVRKVDDAGRYVDGFVRLNDAGKKVDAFGWMNTAGMMSEVVSVGEDELVGDVGRMDEAGRMGKTG